MPPRTEPHRPSPPATAVEIATGQLLDLLGLTAGVFRLDGTCCYLTEGLQELVGPTDVADPQWRRLVRAARWPMVVGGQGGEAILPGWRHERVELPPDPRSGERLVVVRLESARLVRVGAAQLRSFGLTPREGEVAGLLAEGLRNEELARVLGISQHTARRHTERVLLKLGVDCRARVAAVLAGATGTRQIAVGG